MKLAIVHDLLREYGGAERVVEAMHGIWPEAPVYTSFIDWKGLGPHSYRFKGWDIRPSWMQRNWFVKKFHSPLRFLAPDVWESFDLSAYDVVITSSGWFMCRGVAMRKYGSAEVANKDLDPSSVSSSLNQKSGSLRENESGQNFVRSPQSKLRNNAHNGPLQICYIHHPPRNLYGYATGSELQKYWPVRVYAAIINFFLRHYDYATAQKVDYFVANSKETARRVQKFYRRDSTVIYPPVDINPKSKILNPNQIQNSKLKKGYFLSVGRLTYSKQLDVIILACNALRLPLKIVGKGKEEARLKELAGPTVDFVGSVTDEELDALYKGAKAFIFCALDEDFGIVPVEAMARGVPVIALAQGGVMETVVDSKTGLLFDEPTPESLQKVLSAFLHIKRDWSVECRKQAQKFNADRFKKELKAFVEKKYQESKTL